MPATEQRSRKATALMEHALVATRPRSQQELDVCRSWVSRARDFLLHEPATAMIRRGLTITSKEADTLRAEAVAELRSLAERCGIEPGEPSRDG